MEPKTPDSVADLAHENAKLAVAATTPEPVGDHGLLVRLPDGWKPHLIDIADHEYHPRYRNLDLSFATVESICRYVNRYRTGDTLAYMSDVTNRGVSVLSSDHSACKFVLDDYSDDLEAEVANRDHIARLVLKPTTAARRWGLAMAAPVTQAAMVELVVDGVSEIASPPAADLRDLVRDLHAIRTSSAKSVVRLDGGFGIEVTENVDLHAGKGHQVAIPEAIQIVLQPWTAIEATIGFEVKVRPVVSGEQVTFRLSAPHLEDALNGLLRIVHHDITEATTVEPYWI